MVCPVVRIASCDCLGQDISGTIQLCGLIQLSVSWCQSTAVQLPWRYNLAVNNTRTYEEAWKEQDKEVKEVRGRCRRDKEEWQRWEETFWNSCLCVCFLYYRVCLCTCLCVCVRVQKTERTNKREELRLQGSGEQKKKDSCIFSLQWSSRYNVLSKVKGQGVVSGFSNRLPMESIKDPATRGRAKSSCSSQARTGNSVMRVPGVDIHPAPHSVTLHAERWLTCGEGKTEQPIRSWD